MAHDDQRIIKWLCPISLSVTCLLLAALLLAATSRGADAEEGWVRTWMAPSQAIPQEQELPAFLQAPDVAGRTVRQIMYPALGGQEVRLHISNRYSDAPLDILEVRIAKAAGDTAATHDAGMAITFNGSHVLHLPPGGEADSDIVGLVVESGQPYAASLYLGADQRLEAWHRVSSLTNYISTPGNHAGEMSGDAYQTPFMHYAWVTSLSVNASSPAEAVLAIGDSLTDGLRASPDLMRSWPDALLHRLAGDPLVHGLGPRMAIVNAGIAGNRLLSDSACFGENLLTRFGREIADAPDIRTVIVLIGINDINFAAAQPHVGLDCFAPQRQVTADDLIAGYRQLAVMAHHRQMRILMGTLMPGALPPDREKTRLTVNAWIRGTTEIDGVVDFDRAMVDPVHPDRLAAAVDGGDHLHPNDAGYTAMAQAVPLQLLAPPQLSATATNELPAQSAQ